MSGLAWEFVREAGTLQRHAALLINAVI